MKILFVGDKHGQTRGLSLGRWTRALLSLCLIGVPLGFGGVIGYQIATAQEVLDEQSLLALKDRTRKEQQDIADTKHSVQQQLQALTLKMAALQARLIRLDALGERITAIAKLDKGEFDFSQIPAVGGPVTAAPVANQAQTDIVLIMDRLVERVDNRAQQLEILETLLANRKIEDDIFLAGRPIKKGWMSSHFGTRIDPFTGLQAVHEGVDFAGKEGGEVIAVASGIVTWSGEQNGYGRMVEINHGSGYVTRYAHNLENKIEVGDVVKKGQVVALMGSSGRSTGPHVHFEVYKHGRPVDPATYIHRTNR